MAYRTTSVPVRGGDLCVADWTPDHANLATVPTILAVHGITASHRAWAWLVRALAEYRIVAPDLRGRGHSASLPAPYGFKSHAEDVATVASALQLVQPLVLGHSMGAFVATHLHGLAPSLASSTILIDGALPFELPPGVDISTAVAATLGITMTRLAMTFPNREAYRNFWRAHPAFQEAWSEDLGLYADYDLVAKGDGFGSSTSAAVIAPDTEEVYGSTALEAALASFPAGTLFLNAPRGFRNEPPGLYPPEARAKLSPRFSNLRMAEIPDVNHYTIVMSDAGAGHIAEHVRSIKTK